MSNRLLIQGMLLISLLAAPAAGETAKVRFAGSFLQLWEEHWNWTPAQWDALFENLSEIGITKLVVQWTRYDDVHFYHSESQNSARPGMEPLEAVLKRADGHKMSVSVGLAHQSDYWEKLKRDPELVRVSLRRMALRSMELARELYPRLRKHKSFSGWYLPEEIDDVNWRQPFAREVLTRHLRYQLEELHELSANQPVAISGFSNAQLSPEELAGFWNGLLTEAPADVLLFQDGVGAGKLPLRELSTYYAPLSAAVREAGCRFHPVVELFEGRESDLGAFSAEAAEFGRVQQQMELATQFGDTLLFAFSIPDYMNAADDPRTQRLREDYLRMVAAKDGSH